MKITHKFIDIDGSEGTRSNSEDFGTVGNRFLKRIFDIVGDENEKLLEEINDCLNKYNQGNYEKASTCLSKIIKANPAIAGELEPFQEICSRVLSCEKNDTDLFYEKYIDGRFDRNVEVGNRGAEHLNLSASISCTSAYHLPARKDEDRSQLVHTNCVMSATLSMTESLGLTYLPGPLIAVADAIMRRIEGSLHTWFFVFVRAVAGEDAIILPPLHLRGTETSNGWQPAFAAIPDDILSRIVALVSDGHRSLMLEALWRGWLVQRCHFHLLKALQARRSRWSSSQHRAEGIEIHALVERVLTQGTDEGLSAVLSRIEEIGWTTSSKKLSIALLGFVTHAEEFRTYRVHPGLNLPTTNNTAESLNALIQSLSGRARGFRTVVSFNAWIIALCKERQTIKCRGARPQN